MGVENYQEKEKEEVLDRSLNELWEKLNLPGEAPKFGGETEKIIKEAAGKLMSILPAYKEIREEWNEKQKKGIDDYKDYKERINEYSSILNELTLMVLGKPVGIAETREIEQMEKLAEEIRNLTKEEGENKEELRRVA